MKAVRYLLSALFIAAGALLALYGLFALAYTGEASGGTTTIEIAGRELDGHLAGALSLALGGGLFGSAYLIARGRS